MRMPEWMVLVLVLAGWIVLQAWVFPRLGIPT
jgi:hypothetical protein